MRRKEGKQSPNAYVTACQRDPERFSDRNHAPWAPTALTVPVLNVTIAKEFVNPRELQKQTAGILSVQFGLFVLPVE